LKFNVDNIGNKKELCSYDYLVTLEIKATEAENRQVERWKKSDKECQSAIMIEDTDKVSCLLNNMHYRVREIVLDCMICV
jgi:hypothetical protein